VDFARVTSNDKVVQYPHRLNLVTEQLRLVGRGGWRVGSRGRTLRVQGRLAGLVLRHLVDLVLLALLALAECPLRLRNVDLRATHVRCDQQSVLHHRRLTCVLDKSAVTAAVL